jgi:hypothetical protein
MKSTNRTIHYCVGEKLDGSRVSCHIVYEGRKTKIRVNDSHLRQNEYTLFPSSDPESEFMIRFGIEIIERKLGQNVDDMYERMNEFNEELGSKKELLPECDLGIIKRNK